MWEVCGSLTSVPHRTLAFNRFTGTIPANIGKLPRLKWLYVVTCRLWWNIKAPHLIVVVLPLSTPSELCMIIAWKDPCHPLDAIRHNYNGCKMHINRPLNSLHHTVWPPPRTAYNNQLSGTLPPTLSKCTQLRHLYGVTNVLACLQTDQLCLHLPTTERCSTMTFQAPSPPAGAP